MEGRLKLRLGELGITLPAEDASLLGVLLERAKLALLAQTGQSALPKELKEVVVDMAAGEYLLLRKNTGGLEGFDQDYAIRQMSQGDTSITYAVEGGALSPLEVLIEGLRKPPVALVQKWRRMRW